MSAHCDKCGRDLAYDLSCGYCELREAFEEPHKRIAAMEPVVAAAIASVEADTKSPLVGVPSRDQPWTQARAKLAAAVETFRLEEKGDEAK